MIMELEELQARAEEEIDAARTEEALLAVRTKYLGRKGLLTAILRHIGTAQPEERQRIGKRSNEIKEALSSRIDQRLLAAAAAGQEAKLQREKVDCTLPGRALRYGRLHPVTQVCHEICEIFGRLGFSVEEGPEVETDRYNFEALNIPPDHPARDMQDTFYIEEGIVLRTHTSPVQVRTMERVRPPIRILSPGRVYRPDSDVSHTPMFHQVEGLMVDRGVTFGDLKGVLTYFVHEIFGPGIALKFRPSFFPFTEPSAEVDLLLLDKAGNQTWVEMGGCGMVDPNVFDAVGIDSERYTGWAFGFGIERLAMRKYNITDIRLLFENDLRFLSQF